MTSEEHLTVDELAELAEGLLTRRRAAQAREHLDSCAECAARAAALEQTTQALRDLGPVSMPAAVVARLDRALGDADAGSGETVVPDLSAARRRRALLSRPIAAAAAIVVIAGAGIGIGIGTTRHHHAGQTALSPASAPLVGTSAPPQLIQRETGQTYTPDTLAALAPALLGGNGDLAAGSATTESNGGGAAAGTPSVAGPQVGAAPHVPAATPTRGPIHKAAPNFGSTRLAPAGVVPAPLRRYAHLRTTLLACAAYITDTPGAAPLAVDYARWTNAKAHLHNAPSLILVFADPDDDSVFDVYVVAPSCDSASLRDFTQIPRAG